MLTNDDNISPLKEYRGSNPNGTREVVPKPKRISESPRVLKIEKKIHGFFQ